MYRKIKLLKKWNENEKGTSLFVSKSQEDFLSSNGFIESDKSQKKEETKETKETKENKKVDNKKNN